LLAFLLPQIQLPQFQSLAKKIDHQIFDHHTMTSNWNLTMDKKGFKGFHPMIFLGQCFFSPKKFGEIFIFVWTNFFLKWNFIQFSNIFVTL
jgi:hypothetical protein